MKQNEPYRDSDFLRHTGERTIPLTKREVRILVTSLLGIAQGDEVLDIGAGTGGLSLEAARIAEPGVVTAVEMREDALKVLELNRERFGADNLNILSGKAPEILDKELQDSTFDKIIIGGSSGELKDLVKWSARHLKAEGSVCAAFIALENCVEGIKLFKENFSKTEVLEAAFARGRDVKGLTMMIAQNPIFLVFGKEPHNGYAR